MAVFSQPFCVSMHTCTLNSYPPIFSTANHGITDAIAKKTTKQTSEQESFENLMDTFQIPTLENRRLYLSLCICTYLLQYCQWVCVSTSIALCQCKAPSPSHMFRVPFAHSNSLMSLFFQKSVLGTTFPQKLLHMLTYIAFITTFFALIWCTSFS